MISTSARPAPTTSGRATQPAARGPRVVSLVILVTGGALAVLMWGDGSLGWGAGRVLGVLAVTLGGAWYARGAGSVGRGLVALLLGIAGTAAGGGIGAAHATGPGISVILAAAVVALATGVVLLVWGTRLLVRATPGWRRLLAVPLGLAVLLVILVPIGMAVNVTNRPAKPLGPDTPADRGVSYEDVTFRTTDGVLLSAWYAPSDNGAGVVLVHGSGSTRSAVLDHMVVLARHGYGVLALDTRGHGRSGGRAMDFGWHGELDLEAAVGYLEGRPDVMEGRIAAVGLSMGGEQALAAVGSDPRLRAVVAEGVTGMQTADHGWLWGYGGGAPVQAVIDRVTYGAADLLSDASPPTPIPDAIAEAAPRPILLIAGGAVPDEPVAARYFQEAAPGSVEVWVVSGAEHTRALAARPEAWEARVVGFLDEALRT